MESLSSKQFKKESDFTEVECMVYIKNDFYLVSQSELQALYDLHPGLLVFRRDRTREYELNRLEEVKRSESDYNMIGIVSRDGSDIFR